MKAVVVKVKPERKLKPNEEIAGIVTFVKDNKVTIIIEVNVWDSASQPAKVQLVDTIVDLD